MTLNISAIYENGVLRPLRPLLLPERTQVQLEIQPLASTEEADVHRRAVRDALIAAGLSYESSPIPAATPTLAEERRAALAYRFAEAGPVSSLIIAEREETDA